MSYPAAIGSVRVPSSQNETYHNEKKLCKTQQPMIKKSRLAKYTTVFVVNINVVNHMKK